MKPHGVTFNFGSAKVHLPAPFETCFSYDKVILFAANDYCIHQMHPITTM